MPEVWRLLEQLVKDAGGGLALEADERKWQVPQSGGSSHATATAKQRNLFGFCTSYTVFFFFTPFLTIVVCWTVVLDACHID